MSKIKQGDYVYVDWELLKVLSDLEITNGKEIMLLAKILSLSKNKDKACTASNDYLSSFFCTTDRNIRKYLQDLKDKGLIKVFEQKEGLRTTTRYIYPQYDKLKLAPEELFQSSDEGAEQKGQSTGTDVPKERNTRSELEEQMGRHIIEDIREENNIVEESAASPIANAPIPKQRKNKKSNKTKITEEIKSQIWKLFQNKYSYDEIRESLNLPEISDGKLYYIIEEGKKCGWKTKAEREAEQKRFEEKMDIIASNFDETPEEHSKRYEAIWEERRKENERKAEEERKKQEERERKILEEVGIY